MTDEFAERKQAEEKRVRQILRKYKSIQNVARSARAAFPDGIGCTERPWDLMARERRMQDWKLDIEAALRACGRTGMLVLLARSTRQEKSQANGFEQIGRDFGMMADDAEMVFDLALSLFVAYLRKHGIADDYADRVDAASVIREIICAARELGESCPLAVVA